MSLIQEALKRKSEESSPAPAAAGPSSATGTAGGQTVPPAVAEADEPAVPETTDTAGAPADRPAETKSAEPQWPELQLSGIAFLGERGIAIINGSMLSEGEQIDGVLIHRVEANRVILEWNGKRRTLHVN